MSGFKDDVISILRDNVMLHAEAMGLVLDADAGEESRELLQELQKRKFPVTDRVDKHVFMFDYIVIHRDYLFISSLLQAFSWAGRQGIVILDITGKADMFSKRLVSAFGGFIVQKLIYQDRAYLVIKNGVDYGN